MVTGARESWTYHSHGLERKAMSASTLGARLSLSTLTQFRIQTQKQYCPLSGWLFSNQLITRTSPYRHAHNQNIHLQTRPRFTNMTASPIDSDSAISGTLMWMMKMGMREDPGNHFQRNPSPDDNHG